MPDVEQKISCTECGEPLPSKPVSDADTGKPCDNCGSTARTIHIGINEVALDIHDQLKIEVKDPSLPSKKKVRKEIIAGDDYRKSKGDWVYKERVIDRDEGTYSERVVDKDTEEVIHEVHEPLNKHQGHGSDKKKP